MRINILRLTFEFKFPSVYEYQQIKKFIKLMNSTTNINMEDITYTTQNYNKLQQSQPSEHSHLSHPSHSHIVIYNQPDMILKQLDDKIDEYKTTR